MVTITSTYIHKLLRELEKLLIQKNGYHLLGDTYEIILLIPSDRYSSDTNYSMVISAKILNDYRQRDVIMELLTSLKTALNPEEYSTISRINVLHSEDPVVKNIKRMFGFRQDITELNNITVGGVTIDFAYLLKSLVLDKLVENRALTLEILDGEGNYKEIKAGIIRIDKFFNVHYYTAKGLKELFAPETEEEKEKAAKLKLASEYEMMENQYLFFTNLDKIVKVI